MPQSFDVVVDLIGEALCVAGVRVILACREFDVENDHRIRALAGRPDMSTVRVGVLPIETVKAAIECMGLDPARMTATQLALLQSPLHLVLLSSIAGQDDALSFQSRGSLFAAFWERKRRAAKARREGVRFNDTLARVASAASDRQTLSVPIEVLDEGDLLDDANVLVSEHVLVRDGDRIAFFHETFFDYAFARQWVSGDESMVKFLVRDEQELFRRSQVRQILQHLHEREPERFLRELEELLTSVDIRFHIKEAALEVFANLPEPTTAEANLTIRVAATKPSWEGRLWQELRRPQWFNRFYKDGLIAAWLSSNDDQLTARAVDFMVGGAKDHGDAVAELLEAWPTALAYLDQLRWVLRFADVHTNRRLFDLLLGAVRAGAYDEAEQELWFTVRGLAAHQPVWAVELLQARLVDHINALALNPDGKVEALAVREHGAIELVRVSAATQPRTFVQTIVPYLLGVMAATEYQASDGGPLIDRHFSYRFPDSDSNDRELDDALLSATTHALQTLVRSDPETTKTILEDLARDPHEAAQYLLYRALAAGEDTFADWAAELLLQGSGRLKCGYISDSHWVAREVVKTIAPNVDDTVHGHLEDLVRDLHNPYERGPSFGWTAFTFLSALDEVRLSKEGVRRLQEYRRKFNQDAPSEPTGITSGSVTSPIEDAAVTKMTDAQWLRAMAKHDKRDHDRILFKGSARELSQQLRLQVASDPGRFAKLALQVTADRDPAYGDAILMGFGDAASNVETEAVFAAIRHIASLGHPDNDRWLGWALRRHFRDAPLDLVEMVLDRAMHSTDPADSKPLFTPSGHDRRADGLRMSGINTTRGSLAESLGDLLIYDADGQRTELVRHHLDELASDPVLSVRSCVAHTIGGSLRHARPAAYTAFERLIEADDILLAADLVQQLMVYIGNVNPEVIEPVIQRMLSSEDDEAQEAGGQLAAFAALEWERPELLVQALDAEAPVRQGVARTCAARLESTSNVELATSALLLLLNDGDQDVRKAASEVALNLRGHQLRPFATLLEALIDSPSYEEATPQLLITLEDAPDQVDDLALRATQRFLTSYGKEAGDIRTSAAGDAHYISELVVRGLAQSRDRAHRAALLDVLDQLLELGVLGIGVAIAASERI